LRDRQAAPALLAGRTITKLLVAGRFGDLLTYDLFSNLAFTEGELSVLLKGLQTIAQH
jgi:hypothetical protein